MIEELARRVDFCLGRHQRPPQYLLAVDRNNSRVADLYDDLHPAVLRALDQVVRGARTFRRPVGVCGELAGNPMATILLMGLGVDSLSMSAGSLMKVKWVVRSFSVSRARQLLHAALRMEDACRCVASWKERWTIWVLAACSGPDVKFWICRRLMPVNPGESPGSKWSFG